MPENYLRQILAKYSPAARQPQVNAAFTTIHGILVPWAGGLLHAYQPSGSFAKGTSILLGTDLDIFFCLSNNCTDSLRDIYTKTRNHLAQAGYSSREQNVSLRISCAGITCDIVPARKQAGNTADASLYRRKADSWTLTNVDRHIELIANSGRRDEIRIMKIWLSLHQIDVPSFYIELLVLEALSGYRYGLAPNTVRVLEFIRDRARTLRLVDPSNTNNIVSDDVTLAERGQVVSLATRALSGNWTSFVW